MIATGQLPAPSRLDYDWKTKAGERMLQGGEESLSCPICSSHPLATSYIRCSSRQRRPKCPSSQPHGWLMAAASRTTETRLRLEPASSRNNSEDRHDMPWSYCLRRWKRWDTGNGHADLVSVLFWGGLQLPKRAPSSVPITRRIRLFPLVARS